jgi:hypothetical protein
VDVHRQRIEVDLPQKLDRQIADVLVRAALHRRDNPNA